MEYNAVFSEYPVIAEWGASMSIVPLNIRETHVIGEDEELKTIYLADLVKVVNNPVNVDSIVEAVVNETFSEADQKYIMRNFGTENDAMVAKYKKLVTDITKLAKESGYK